MSSRAQPRPAAVLSRSALEPEHVLVDTPRRGSRPRGTQTPLMVHLLGRQARLLQELTVRR
jgi:hypothetical protein